MFGVLHNGYAWEANMNGDRVRYITHWGRRILLVDYTDCTAAQFATICDLVPSYVTPEPEHTVLLLADFSKRAN